MKKKTSFSEMRYLRRMSRSTKCMLLHMHAETLTYRAARASYERWTTTDSYQKEKERMREIVRIIREEYGEEIEFRE